MISRIYIAGVRRFHFLLLLATMVPWFCFIITFGMPANEADAAVSRFLPLYLFTFSLVIPAAFLYFIQEKVPNLGIFLLCAGPVCLLFLACAFALESAIGLSVRGAEKVPQFLILLLFVLDAIRMRTNDNSRRKAKVQEDHSWTGDLYLLPLPALPFLIAFAILYVGALFLHSNELAQVALVGAILYFFLVLPYHVLIRKNAFLERRHHINRIPEERIGMLQRAALLRVLIPCALLAFIALMTAGGRRFLDLPAIRLTIVPDPMTEAVPAQNGLMRELMELGLLTEGAPPPEWLIHLINFVENALTVLMTAILLYGLYRIIRSVYLRFRKEYEDEPSSFLAARVQDEHISLKAQAGKIRRSGNGGGIRRRYRRTILRYRKRAPEIYETPSLMEERSGIPDTPQMRTLHDDYIRTRYSRSPSGYTG